MKPRDDDGYYYGTDYAELRRQRAKARRQWLDSLRNSRGNRR
jgi:hypothetical protein